MGINEKMTSIADGLRTLSSTSEPMGLDAMSGYISQANDTVDAQSALITQIKRALRGKGTATDGTVEPAKEEQEVVFPTITENGNYEILPDDGKVMPKAIVNVEVPERYEEGYSEGQQVGYNEGYSKGFADNEPVLEALNATENGEYTPPQNVDGFSSVTVNVSTEVADSVLLESGTCGDNVSWKLYNNGLLYIFGEGVMHTYNFNNAPFKFKSIKNVIIENGITTIGDYLLTHVTSLKSVCIPDSVISIGKQVFYRCFGLENITFGSGLTKIDYAAFADCETLTNIFYKGTKSEWDLINIDKGYNEYLLAATLHCEYEEGNEKPYERVGYIPFNADLCFDTGVICNQNTKLKIVFTRDSSNAMYMYGVADSQNLQSVTAYLSSGGSWRFGNKSTSYNAVVDGDIVQTAIVSKTGIVRANASSTFSDVNDFETIGSLILGACRLASGNIGAAQFIGKIYEFKMWNGDELILDFEPCINNENVYGFFDTITETFIAPISTNSVEEVSVDE